MKRTLSLVLALIMVLGTFTTVFAATEAEKTAAEFLADEGILLGADGDLMLDKNLERRDAVILLSRLLGVEDEAAEFLTTEDSPSWEDARTDAYYVPFFAWAEENGYFEGDDEGNFNPRNAITAQEYALVLLRALDYDVKGHDAWKAALETAEKLGLLKDVEVENADKVVRAQMAAMTFNALGTKMNDSDKTLAEKLEIEMPEAPKADKLTAEVNDTENLAEIVVELSNADLASIERLEDESNYRLNDNNIEIKEAKVVGDNVVLTLVNLDTRVGSYVLNNGLRADVDNNNNSLVKNRKYTLSVRGIDRDIDGSYDFRAYDNAAPAVESVVALGEYGIKITTTEPVELPAARNFRVNNRIITMNVEQYGRDIIITPYSGEKFSVGETELEILELRDFANYRSSALVETFEVETDDEAPEVVSATRARNGNFVIVEFDKDIAKSSVGGYSNYRTVGNISYRDGRQTIYAEGVTATETVANPRTFATQDAAKKTTTNVVVYRFKNELPRNVEFTIEGVENHSKVKMERTSIVPTISLEDEVAEVINGDKTITVDPNTQELTIKFDREVEVPGMVYANTTIENGGYFNLYARNIDSRYRLTHSNNIVYNSNGVNTADTYEILSITHGDNNRELKITFNGLNRNNNARAYDYIIEIANLVDANGNRIARSYVDFELKLSEGLQVATTQVYAREIDRNTEFRIAFTNPNGLLRLDKNIAEDASNYIFIANGSRKTLESLGGYAELQANGVDVIITVNKTLQEFGTAYDNNGRFLITSAIRTNNGTLINGETLFNISVVKTNNTVDSVEFK